MERAGNGCRAARALRRLPVTGRGYIPGQMFLVVLPTAAVILGDSLIYIVLPVRVSEFGLDDWLGLSAAFWIGLALSINRFIRVGGNVLAAATYRRFGFKAPFVAAVLVGGLTTLSYAFTRGAGTLLAARAAWGLSYSHLRLGAYLAAFEVGGAGRRGRLLGFFNAGQRTGSFLAVTAGAALADQAGRTVAFSALSAVGLAGLALALAAPNFTISGLAATRHDGRDAPPRPDLRDRAWNVLVSPVPEAARALRRRMLAVNYLRFGTAFAANGLVIATISPFLVDLYGETAKVFGTTMGVVTLAGALVGVRWFGDLLLAVPAGHASDVFGRRKAVTVGAALTLAAMLVVGLSDRPEIILAALPLLLIAGSTLGVVLDAAAVELAPEETRAGAMARYATWLDLGAATGPMAGFLIADALGYQAGYLIAACLLVSGIAGYLAATRAAPATSPARRRRTRWP